MKFIKEICRGVILGVKNISPPDIKIVKIYGIFSTLNFLFFYFMNGKILIEDSQNVMRAMAVIMGAILSIYQYWPVFLKKHLRAIWYISICYSFPFFGSVMFLENADSLLWQSNIIIGIFWLGLLTDYITFVIILCIGTILGVVYYRVIAGEVYLGAVNLHGIEYHYVFAFLVSFVFSRTKELFTQSNYISGLEKLHKVIAEKSKKLEDALSVKTEFLNNISHEIRTPINGFSMATENLKNNWLDLNEKERREMIEIIAKSAKRIKSLAAHLIKASELAEGKNLLNLQPINLTYFIKDIVEEVNLLYIGSKNIEIKFSYQKEYKVLADNEALGQVLRNILVNAIKFSPSNSLIEIYIEPNKRMLKVFIKDQGPGVPKDELDSIFKPFVQSSRTKNGSGGVGLGLSIVKEIIKGHGGRIWVKNHKIGCSFIFTLKQVSEKKKNKQVNGKILVIDDEYSILQSIKLGLMSKKLRVSTASSGEEGLEYLERNIKDVDLVLLDIMMPGMDGTKVLKIIKDKYPHLRVIMQSGMADKGEISKSTKLGAEAFFRKPYTIEELFNYIQNS
jgi:two-component system sensor histidine kinase ChiS